jgi:hypothetical protein
MGRAFREGIAPEKRVRFKHKMTRILGLGSRAKVSKTGEGPRTRVPAMITIENDEWIWEQVSQEILSSLSHRLMVQGLDGNSRPLGCTADFDTALALAKEMANDGEVVLIEAM